MKLWAVPFWRLYICQNIGAWCQHTFLYAATHDWKQDAVSFLTNAAYPDKALRAMVKYGVQNSFIEIADSTLCSPAKNTTSMPPRVKGATASYCMHVWEAVYALIHRAWGRDCINGTTNVQQMLQLSYTLCLPPVQLLNKSTLNQITHKPITLSATRCKRLSGP